MTTEEIKKLDKRISKIQYPFGENFLAFHKLFIEVAKQEGLPLQDVVRQYVGWKCSKK